MLMTYLGKYRVIALSIALFLVFDLGVLVLNFIISSQIAADAVSVNLAGRQRMLSQRTVKSLLQIQEARRNAQDAQPYTTELRQTFDLFDRTLSAFRDGGAATGGDGKPVILNRIDRADGRQILDRAYVIWDVYREKINAVLAANDHDDAVLSEAIRFASDNNVSLLGLMNKLTSYVESVAGAKAGTLRIVQIVGISLATLNFLLILFHFIRQLRRNDRALEHAHKQTEEILDTTSEGMFLLDKNYCIGSLYSRALARMFGRDDLAGTEFLELIRPLVPERTVSVATDYIGLLFGNRVNEKLVRSVNPLDRVEVSFADGHGSFERKFLTFEFSRVTVDKELSHLLVTVNDITERVLLEHEVERSQQEAQAQMDLLLEIIHVEPKSLAEFIANADKSLNEINDALKQNSTRREEMPRKIDAIARSMHGIKGEAAAIGLGVFENRAHRFEDALDVLRQKTQLDGDDFLSLTILLKEMFALYGSIRDLLAKLADLRVALAPEGEVRSVGASDCDDLERLAQRIAERQQKAVILEHEGLCASNIPTLYRQSLKLIATQLLRNAIVHGIEPPEHRRELRKPAVGSVRTHLRQQSDGGYQFSFRDDGAGISLDRIREHAIATGRMTREDASRLTSEELLHLLFEPTFSTASKVDEDAGRGVGLDLVIEVMRKIGGRLSLRFAAGRYCEFTITLPAVPAALSSAA